MEQIPEVRLSVTTQAQNCLLELDVNPGQLAIARCVIEYCQHELGPALEKVDSIPQVVFEKIELEPSARKPIKIAVVGAFAGNTPCLVKSYVKENFSGMHLKENLFAEIVSHKVIKNGRKVSVEVRRINATNFAWDKESDYLNSIDVIVLAVNATAKTVDSVASIKEVFEKVLCYFRYPDIPLILVGIRSESSKFPRQEMVEAFAETVQVPYIECFINKDNNVTSVLNMAVDMGIHQKMPAYKYQVVCRNLTPEVFQNPDFYIKLNRRILDSFPREQLPIFSFDPRMERYRCVSNYLEVQERYWVLLRFHFNHIKSNVVAIQKNARAYLLQLENSSLGQIIIDKLVGELEQGSTESKNIISILKMLSDIINIKLYSLTLTLHPADFEALNDFIRHVKSLVNLTLVFKGLQSEVALGELGATVMLSSLRRLKFVMPMYFTIKEFKGFKDVFELHPTLLSLDFSDCRLSKANVAEIVEAVSHNVVLQELNLAGNYVSDDAVSAVKRLLKTNRQLQRLSISNGQVGMTALSRVLSGVVPGMSLRAFTISRNRLSEVGVVCLLKGLSENPQLTTLDVSFCSLSYFAMNVFLTGLEKIDSIRVLSLAGNFNQFTQEWLVKVIHLLQINKTLKKIDLSQNLFLDEGAELIANFLRHNKTLECLDLSSTKMTDAGLVALAEILHVNYTLHELVMRKNTYTSVGVSTLLFALSKNVGLLSLDIGASVLCKDALSSLMGLIPENQSLRAFGFMPDQKKRTVELLALYDSAFQGNKIITSTYEDFNCHCGRCLCVKSKQVVSATAENRLNRYKNLALLIKAYFDPEENGPEMFVFKRIPKDVLLVIFKIAYPELPQKVFASISSSLFFKPRNAVASFHPRRKAAKMKTLPVRLNFLAVDVLLEQDNEDVVLTLASDERDYQTLCHMTAICRENLHLLLPYNNKSEVEIMCIKPKKLELIHENSEDELMFRIALMGEVASGKTAFAKRFAHNVYSEHSKASIGVDFVEKSMILGNTHCKLRVLDLAGTRPQDSFTRIYLRETSGILLTVDLTRPHAYEETYQRILTESSFPDIPILMVGLKSDISKPEAVLKFRAIAEKLNIPCMIASAKTSENVNDVFDILLRMMVTKKMPGYLAELRIKKVTLDWFALPRFYGELNQLFLEEISLYRPVAKSDFNYQYYLGAVQWLRDKNDPKVACRFFIKNIDSVNDFIKDDAIKNLARIRDETPDCLKVVMRLFHEWLTVEGYSYRYEAIEGLRKLGELHTQTVRSICLRVFERIHFSSNYSLDSLVKKIKDYNRSDLIRDSLSALSAVHASCFTILQEMGAKQACEHIEHRVLEALEIYLKRLQNFSADFSSGKFRLSKK